MEPSELLEGGRTSKLFVSLAEVRQSQGQVASGWGGGVLGRSLGVEAVCLAAGEWQSVRVAY